MERNNHSKALRVRTALQHITQNEVRTDFAKSAVDVVHTLVADLLQSQWLRFPQGSLSAYGMWYKSSDEPAHQPFLPPIRPTLDHADIQRNSGTKSSSAFVKYTSPNSFSAYTPFSSNTPSPTLPVCGHTNPFPSSSMLHWT